MDIVFSQDPRDFARRDWSALVRADPAGTFFHTPGFLKIYWEEFADQPDHLLLAFAEEDGDQVGAVAFERLDGTLRFLGGTEVTDYMGPVALPEARSTVAKELFAALGRADDWAEADLRGLPEDQPWLELLVEAAAAQGFSTEVLEDQNGVAPILPYPARTRSTSSACPRNSVTRSSERRVASRARSVRGTSAWRRRRRSSPFLDRFVELHRTSEGPKGVFMQPGMEIFFRRLGEEFLPLGVFSLTFIETAEHVKLAGSIGFRFEGTYSLYNSAFDRAYVAASPGMVLVAEDIRIAIEAGCSAFDMLKGDYAYKYRFGATPRAIRRLIVRR